MAPAPSSRQPSSLTLAPARVLSFLLYSRCGLIVVPRIVLELAQLGRAHATHEFPGTFEHSGRTLHAWACAHPRLWLGDEESVNAALQAAQQQSGEARPLRARAGRGPREGPRPELEAAGGPSICLGCGRCSRARERSHPAAHKSRLCVPCHEGSRACVLVLRDSDSEEHFAVARCLGCSHSHSFLNLCMFRFRPHGRRSRVPLLKHCVEHCS